MERIKLHVSNFETTDNLFELAEAYILLQELLKEHEFPIREYIKWKKK